jgi:valine dehydrogenase (NAD+)
MRTGLRPGLDPDCGRRPRAIRRSQGKIYNATRSKTTNLGSLRFQGIAVFDTTLRVLAAAEEEGISPAVMADHMAEERMARVARLATLRLQRGW